MGKKKRGHPDLEEILSRPWCYYCERDFDDLKILISHQKAKHFKCDRCGRRLNTAGGLSVHMSQVHKEALTAVDNALPNRSSLDIEIFGMEGVPEDIMQAHNQRVLTQFHQAEAERRAATGNPAPGSISGGSQPKKPKFESPSELKKRLAEHKAKLAEQAAGGSSGDATPVGAGQGLQSGSGYTGASQFPAAQPLNGSSQQFPYPQAYGQSGAAYQQGAGTFQKQSEYLSPGYQQFQNPQYSPPGMSSQQYQPGPAVPSRALGSSTPPVPFQQQQMPPRTHTPPQTTTTTSFPPRPVTLPIAPGLPQRPSFGAPQVNAFQMQQMHHGQIPVAPVGTTQSSFGQDESQNGQSNSVVETGIEPTSASIDELIAGAASRAGDLVSKPSATTEGVLDEKPAKKEKSKASRMVYSDSETSPEEKMARLPRYAFVPECREGTFFWGATTTAVAEAVSVSDSATKPSQ